MEALAALWPNWGDLLGPQPTCCRQWGKWRFGQTPRKTICINGSWLLECISSSLILTDVVKIEGNVWKRTSLNTLHQPATWNPGQPMRGGEKKSTCPSPSNNEHSGTHRGHYCVWNPPWNGQELCATIYAPTPTRHFPVISADSLLTGTFITFILLNRFARGQNPTSLVLTCMVYFIDLMIFRFIICCAFKLSNLKGNPKLL